MSKEVYDRIKQRLDELGLSEARASKDAGLSVDAIRNIRRAVEAGKKPNVTSRTIESLALALDTSTAWLLGDHDTPPPLPPVTRTARPNASFPPRYQRFNTNRRIPMMGQSEAGPNGRFIMNGAIVADVFCPPGLENVPDAYAVRVYGTSMEPRYKAGETVWLNPQLPVRAGDDVVVQLKPEVDGDEMASYIKEFRSRSSKTLKLWQHNPEDGESKELVFDNDTVFSVHKVVHHATL
jgi:phage repressor protein C with HTH and peptisase S24 domain